MTSVKTKSEAKNIQRANFFCSRYPDRTRALLEATNVLSDQMKDLLVYPWRSRSFELPPYLDALDEIDGEGGPAFYESCSVMEVSCKAFYEAPMDTVSTYLKVKLPDLRDEPLSDLAEKANGSKRSASMD